MTHHQVHHGEGRQQKSPLPQHTTRRKEDGGLDVSVYRKSTHTDRYLEYSSHHPTHVQSGVASCLFHQSRMITKGDNAETEEKHLWKILRDNGYPDHITQQQRNGEDNKLRKNKLNTPRLSEDLQRARRKYGMRTVFMNISTLQK